MSMVVSFANVFLQYSISRIVVITQTSGVSLPSDGVSSTIEKPEQKLVENSKSYCPELS
jgi:hypothetical protein